MNNIELELDREKLSNYILRKENEILLAKVDKLSKDLYAIECSKSYKITRKIMYVLKLQFLRKNK